jgi:hypothetical protein
MSLVLTGGVALAYAAGVIGVHRWAVRRRRARADGFPSLSWLDWDALLSDLWPTRGTVPDPKLKPKEGGPAPLALSSGPPAGRESAQQLLKAVLEGQPLSTESLEAAGFSGGEARWLSWLAQREREPLSIIERLSGHMADSPAESYFLEWLSLRHVVTPVNIEWQVYTSKRRLNAALQRFGDIPALFFARAQASSLLGFTQSVLDDLGRAVFFSRQAPFYVEAVLAMPFVEEARPPLTRACRDANEARVPAREDRVDAVAFPG